MRLCCLILVALASIAKAQTLDSGLVFCLPINNSVEDKVANRTITGYGYSLTQDRKEKSSQAIRFNGSSDYIEVVGFGTALLEREITVSFWAKTEEVKSHFVCVMMPNDPNNRMSIVINYWHSGFKYHFWDVQNTNDGRLGITPTNEDNDWHFYTFTNASSKGEMKAYRDGFLIGSKSTFVSTYQDNRDLRIGKGDVPGSNFHGSIDEFRIYNRVLTHQEIQLLQNFSGCESSLDTTDSNGWSLPCTTDYYQVLPNPAISSFKIKVTQGCSLSGNATLYNALGQLVNTQLFIDNEANFEVHDFASGPYYVRITDASGLILSVKKVIIGI